MLDQEYFTGFAWPERPRERKALGQEDPADPIVASLQLRNEERNRASLGYVETLGFLTFCLQSLNSVDSCQFRFLPQTNKFKKKKR